MRKFLSSFFLFVVIMSWVTLFAPSTFAATTSTAIHRNALTCPQLPSHFDPLQASAAELIYFHLPPRPTDAKQLTDWTQRLRQIKRIVCTDSLIRQKMPLSHPLPQSAKKSIQKNANSPYNTITAPSWSGYLANGSGITDVKGNWNVQCPGQPRGGTNEATWVGIGGVNGGESLAQTGTAFTERDSRYHLFLEYVPANGPGNGDFYMDRGDIINCGTPIYAEVYLQSGEYCTDVIAGNLSVGTCFNSVDHPDQTTGEWIDERPTCPDYQYALLTNFAYTAFSNGYAYSPGRNWHTIAGWAPTEVQMTGNYASPGAIQSGGTNFTDYWHADGGGEVCNI